MSKQENTKPEATVTVFDVAAYILKKYAGVAKKHGVMTPMKLQKLVYYSQAWSLVFDAEPLFGEPIEAWPRGPVERKLFKLYQGRRTIHEPEQSKGNPKNLDDEQRKTIDFVVRNYGPLTPEELVDLTHQESPWKKAQERIREQGGRRTSGRRNERIQHEDMVDYYLSLV